MAGRSAGRSAARTARRTPGHPAAHRPWPAPPAAAAPPPAATTPTTSIDRLWCGTRPRSLLAQGVEAILSTAPAVITDRHAGFSGGSKLLRPEKGLAMSRGSGQRPRRLAGGLWRCWLAGQGADFDQVVGEYPVAAPD